MPLTLPYPPSLLLITTRLRCATPTHKSGVRASRVLLFPRTRKYCQKEGEHSARLAVRALGQSQAHAQMYRHIRTRTRRSVSIACGAFSVVLRAMNLPNRSFALHLVCASRIFVTKAPSILLRFDTELCTTKRCISPISVGPFVCMFSEVTCLSVRSVFDCQSLRIE